MRTAIMPFDHRAARPGPPGQLMMTCASVLAPAAWGFILTLAAATPSLAQADVARIGSRVVQKQPDFNLRIGDRIVDRARRIEIYRVERAEGFWLWLRANGLQGWALAIDVVPVEEAVTFFTGQIAAHPGDVNAYTMRAIVWQHKNEHDIALGDYSEAIRLDPRQAWLFNNRAYLWNTRRQYDKAIADCSEAIRLDPEGAMAYLNRGIAWAEKGEFGRAIKDYDEAIRLDPRNAVARHDRGTALVKTREFSKALADYDEAIRLDPYFAQAYCCRGAARWAEKQYDEALADLNEAVRLDPKHPMSYHNRAYVWAVKKEYDKAIADFDQALRLDPNDVQATKGRAWVVVQPERSRADSLDGKKAAVADRNPGRPIYGG